MSLQDDEAKVKAELAALETKAAPLASKLHTTPGTLVVIALAVVAAVIAYLIF